MDVRDRKGWGKLLGKLADVPRNLTELIVQKWWKTTMHGESSSPMLPFRPDAWKAVRAELELLAGAAGPASGQLTAQEKAVVERIRAATEEANRDNVTRTRAYLEVYTRNPELHWAFLAHMVSRNGGWSMTDLKGELLPYLLDEDQRGRLFRFLEEANWLIFQDAYPQLLLYEAGKLAGRGYEHLLPAFHVSQFMRPFWTQFRAVGDSALLTVALIVNEQNYIERRIVADPYWKEHVLDTPAFRAQSLLQLNQVFFPYSVGGEDVQGLAGLILERFDPLRERIEFGKSLYALLFGVPEVAEGAKRFAAGKPHTGSRGDYWPHVFRAVRSMPPGVAYVQRLDGGKLKEGAKPLYSPELRQAWPVVEHEEPDRSDWFHDMDVLRYFRGGGVRPPHSYRMDGEYWLALNKLELAVLTGEALK